MSLITISPKYQKLLQKYSAPQFRIGFEFEGYIKYKIEDRDEYEYGERDDDNPNYDLFFKELRQICPGIDVGKDGSIEPPDAGVTYDWEPVELRTPALSLSKGIETLDNLLTHFEKWKRAKVWGTNETCGLHINLSENNIFKSDNGSDEFYCRVLQKFHQKRILRMFGRQNNEFCEPLNITKADRENFDKIYDKFGDSAALDEKYLAVANRFGERIEFRCLGNKNYELKKDKINKTVAHIYDCALRSYIECMEAKNKENSRELQYADSEDNSY